MQPLERHGKCEAVIAVQGHICEQAKASVFDDVVTLLRGCYFARPPRLLMGACLLAVGNRRKSSCAGDMPTRETLSMRKRRSAARLLVATKPSHNVKVWLALTRKQTWGHLKQTVHEGLAD